MALTASRSEAQARSEAESAEPSGVEPGPARDAAPARRESRTALVAASRSEAQARSEAESAEPSGVEPGPARDGRVPAPEAKRRFVQAMFDRIAPRYDRLNRLLSFGLDRRWRRLALAAVAAGPGDVVVDLACGTGDLCELAARRGARAVGVDFSRQMLRRAAARRVGAALVQGDAQALPFADASASVITCGFALRNFVSLAAVLAECARVLRPGGRLALLEVDRPRGRLVRAGHSLYFDRVVPRVGALLSDRAAYRYLPESTAYLPPEAALLALIARAGFSAPTKRRFLLGAAQLLVAERRP